MENFGSFMQGLFSLLFIIAVIAGHWKMFEKAGYSGFASIIPIYNLYVLCKIVYGRGVMMIWFLIPIINIYFLITMPFKLAKVFGKGFAFGLGLLFFNPLFTILLGWGASTYLGYDA